MNQQRKGIIERKTDHRYSKIGLQTFKMNN